MSRKIVKRGGRRLSKKGGVTKRGGDFEKGGGGKKQLETMFLVPKWLKRLKTTVFQHFWVEKTRFW